MKKEVLGTFREAVRKITKERTEEQVRSIKELSKTWEKEHVNKETLEELVRDLTTIHPMAKSEARRRIEDYAKAKALELIKKN